MWTVAFCLLPCLPLVHAFDVYLSPHKTFHRSTLSPKDASAVLSRHLGVEAFEPLGDASYVNYEEPFVGYGTNTALLLAVNQVDVEAVLPTSLQPSFNLSVPSSASTLSPSTVISTYLHRARHSYGAVYHDGAFGQRENVDSLFAFYDSDSLSHFAAVELVELSDARQIHGPTSTEYNKLAAQTRAFLERALDGREISHIAILTFAPSSVSLAKRQRSPQSSQSPLPPNHPPPQEPIGSVSTCFTTADACTNGTSSCSGRGQCVEATKSGRTCFICTCEVTKTGEGSKVKTETWVGQSCERKDVSGPFVLLTGTVIVMILLIFGSISLLSSVGDHELPSTLLATAVNAKKD